MKYREFAPGDALKQYVKCYYIYETESNLAFDDTAFATGCIEIMFNLGEGQWRIAVENDFVLTPPIELWGQMISPLKFKSIGKNTMLGIRFFPHTASLFINDNISLLNNQVTDLGLIIGKSVYALHSRLLEETGVNKQLELVEEFLLNKCSTLEKKLNKITLISKVMDEIKHEDFFNNIENVASCYGITSRYLQKIFLQYTGLTPKLYSKINRFQKSLVLIAKNDTTLTSIAYECGYFDQSHFIREFKSFTGIAPSDFLPENSSALLASPNK